MFDKLLQIIAPHYCYSCQKKSSILCESCIYNITIDTKNCCIECRKPNLDGTCYACETGYSKSWVVADREGELARLLHDYKWNGAFEARLVLASLLNNTLPLLPDNTVIVPIPTIPRHRRIRGYDHADLLAQSFADLRNLPKKSLLQRRTNSVQHTADRAQRIAQAEKAFYCSEKVKSSDIYLVVDDIITTGSTVSAAASVLRQAGASEVWVAAVARQPFQV